MNVCKNRERIKYVKIAHRISVETWNFSHKVRIEKFAKYDNFMKGQLQMMGRY